MKQSTLPVKVPGALSALTGLARTIALPHEYAPVRFPSFPALERTAVLGFSVPSYAAVDISSETKFLLARQACFPCWADQTIPSTELWSTVYDYTAENQSFGGGISQAQIFTMQFLRAYSGNRLKDAYGCGVSGGNSGRTPYAPVGYDSGLGNNPNFFYVPEGANVFLALIYDTALTAATLYDVALQKWTSPGEIDVLAPEATTAKQVSSAIGDTAGVVVIPNLGGWYRVESIESDLASSKQKNMVASVVVTNASTFSFGVTTGVGILGGGVQKKLFLPLVFPTEYANSKLPWYSTRTNAASLLLTNVTQVLNKAGVVLAGRVSPSVINPFEVDSAYINTLHPAEKAFLPLESGAYTFVPPSTDMQNFWDYTSVSHANLAGGASTPLYRLDNDSLVNVLFLSSPSVSEAIAVTVDWHIEFRTSSALFPIGLSAMTLESLHQAQLVLTECGFFFNNIDHKFILGQLMKFAKQYVPIMAGAVNPAAGYLARKAVKYFSRKPKPNMPPTTLKAAMPKDNGKRPQGGKGKGKRKGGLQMYLDSRKR